MAVRVLHVIESSQPEAGSVAVLMSGLLQALRSQGIQAEIVAGEHADGARVDHGEPGGMVARVDVVHVHGWSYPLADDVARAARTARKPYVISPHGVLAASPHDPKSLGERVRAWWRGNRLVREAAAVTALHETEAYALRTRRVNENVVRLPCGIDAKEYESVPEAAEGGPFSPGSTRGPNSHANADALPAPRSASDGRCILLMGPLHPAEGFVPLLKALAELGPDADGWNVVLAGTEVGDWRKQLEAAVRRKGGEKRVRFAPAPDPVAQRAWLARASIVASPCLHIRPPVSVLQAAAFGVAVLASSEVAPDGLGEVVHVCAPTRGDIKLGLRRLLGMTDDQRTAMARRSRDVVRERYDWSVLAPSYARLYEGLV